MTAFAVTLLSLAWPNSSVSATEVPTWCPADGVLNAAAMPQEFPTSVFPAEGRLIRDGELGVVIPEAGVVANAEGYSIHPGETDVFSVAHTVDGVITLEETGPESFAASGGEAELMQPLKYDDPVAPECGLDWYDTPGVHEDDLHNWFINVDSIPTDDVGVDSAVLAMREGTFNMSYMRSTCYEELYGPYWNYNPGISTHYAGTTNLYADINVASCQERDGVNVVSFGQQTEFVAYACWWYTWYSEELKEADIEFDATETKWTTRPLGDRCDDEFDLESVMTHERGHTFGLMHVSESWGDRMTMSPIIEGPCQGQERSLGRGDSFGMINLYGQWG